MRNRMVSIVPLPEHKQSLPLMAYEHAKQCLQVAQGRQRADAAIVTLSDQYERDRRRALAFVKDGAMRSAIRLIAAQRATGPATTLRVATPPSATERR